MCGDDAVDEDKLILCCGLCCCNCGLYPALDSIGCSGKAGVCCCNAEMCCKPGAPYLFPLGCIGLKCESDGCSVFNMQCQICCTVVSAAIPCNEEVPLTVNLLGLTLWPKQGCFMTLKETMERGE